MESYLPDSEQRRIDEARPGSVAALTQYLKTKYGYQEGAIEIITNEPETNMFTYEGSEIKQKETINYTGYFTAATKIEGQAVDVRYSPTGSASFYYSGGADNKQTAALQRDLHAALSAALPYAAAITVRAGSLLPLHDGLLDEAYDGKDWFSPIPPDGSCFIQLLIPQDSVALASVQDDLASFFSSYETHSAYVCANIGFASSTGGGAAGDLMPFGDVSAGESLIWENSTWDPTLASQRLFGGVLSSLLRQQAQSILYNGDANAR
jgi:hypothetical protein